MLNCIVEKLQIWGKGIDEKDFKHPRFQMHNIAHGDFHATFIFKLINGIGVTKSIDRKYSCSAKNYLSKPQCPEMILNKFEKTFVETYTGLKTFLQRF